MGDEARNTRWKNTSGLVGKPITAEVMNSMMKSIEQNYFNGAEAPDLMVISSSQVLKKTQLRYWLAKLFGRRGYHGTVIWRGRVWVYEDKIDRDPNEYR